MLYKDLKVKELYASIPDTEIIAKLFETGLKIGSCQLAVSAMEELMLRGDTDIIAAKLQSASDKGQLQLGNSLTGLIARSLVECREDPILHRYGRALFRGHGYEGVIKWMRTPEAEAMFQSEKQPQRESQTQQVQDPRKIVVNDPTSVWLDVT